MLLHVPRVLDAHQLAHFRARLATAGWADGRLTAGYQSAQAKDNAQLPENDPVAREQCRRLAVAPRIDTARSRGPLARS